MDMKFEQNKGLLIFSNVFCPLFSIPHPAPEIGLKYSQTLNIYSFLPAELIFYPTLVRGLECCNSFHLSILALERYIIERRVLHLMRKIPWFSINFQETLTTGVYWMLMVVLWSLSKVEHERAKRKLHFFRENSNFVSEIAQRKYKVSNFTLCKY